MSAEDVELLELLELQQTQFVLACDIDDLQRASAIEQERQGLPGLRTALAAVSTKLTLLQQRRQQQQQQQQ